MGALLPSCSIQPHGTRYYSGLGTGVTASSSAEGSALEVDAVELLPQVISVKTATLLHVFVATRPNPATSLDLLRTFPCAVNRERDRRRYDESSSITPPTWRAALQLVSTRSSTSRPCHARLLGGWRVLLVAAALSARQRYASSSIVQLFLVAFPNGWAMPRLQLADLETPVLESSGLCGCLELDVDTLHAHLAKSGAQETIARLGIDDEFALLGSFIAGPKALRAFAGNAIANTDDRPIVAYRAPRITYAPDSLPRDRLIALLSEVSIEPPELLARAPDEAGRSVSLRTGLRAIASSTPAETCDKCRTCWRCSRKCASRCSLCFA